MSKALIAVFLALALLGGDGLDARERRVPIGGGVVERHAVLPGSSPNYFYSSNAGEVTTDWTVVAQITMDDYTPAAEVSLGGQYDISGNQRNFMFSVTGPTPAGRLAGRLSDNGTNEFFTISDAASGATDGVEAILRWRFDRDNGASQHALYADRWNGSEWDPIGTSPVVAATAIASVFNSTAPVVIGGSLNGATLLIPWAGTAKRIQCFNGLNSSGTPFDGATALWDFNPNDYPGSGLSWVSKLTGETWNINGTASVVPD